MISRRSAGAVESLVSSAVNNGAHSHRDDGGGGEEDRGEGEQPLGVRLAPVDILGTRAHEQWHHDARQHATQQQLVHHARQGVGQVVVIGDGHGSDRGSDRRGTQKAGDPAHNASRRHGCSRAARPRPRCRPRRPATVPPPRPSAIPRFESRPPGRRARWRRPCGMRTAASGSCGLAPGHALAPCAPSPAPVMASDLIVRPPEGTLSRKLPLPRLG